MTPTNYVQVPVPEELVPDVMALITRQIRSGASEAHTHEPATSHAMEALVERCYLESEETHRRLLRYLASRPDQWVSFDDIGAEMGYTSPRSLPGTLGAFGRRAKHRYGGFKPFEAEERDSGKWSLRMESAIAAVITKLAQQ
jgi:hypothetical protein